MLKHLSVGSIKCFCQFLNHNKNTFINKNKDKQSKILVEYNALCDSHIIYSYLTNELAKKYKSEIHSYDRKIENNFYEKIKSLIKNFYYFSYRNIYKSFGVINHITPKKINNENTKNLKNVIFNSINSKKDIFNISIEDVKIGDLIYDGYLRKFNLPTIDIKSTTFKNYLSDVIDLFCFWAQYFEDNIVKAIVLSHTVYEFGIVLRIATKKKIKAFSAGSFFIFSHDENNQTIFDMKYYKTEFKKYPKELQKRFIDYAADELKKKFDGKKTIENKVSALPADSPFAKKKYNKNVLSKNNKKKILIAAHHFSDAPNVYGNFIFNDFYEWIDFLGKKSENSDYEWYIKFHPMEYDSNKKTSDYFLNKYKNLQLINKDITHGQLISEGINLVLTVYGTIGLEYAYFGIPVINAANKNPHIAYDFNYHANSIEDYDKAIDNFDNLNISYNRECIKEYFFMRYLNSFYLFSDELKDNNNFINYQSLEVYNKWLKSLNSQVEKDLKNKIIEFIDSKKFRCVKY
jgi:hypothetical protein